MTSVVQVGEPLLRERAKKVHNFRDPWVRSFLDRLEREVLELDGAGLAAPQLGVGRRMFVARLREEDKQVRRFVNPEIVATSNDTGSAVEGCFSMGAYLFTVSRPMWVELRWQDANGVRYRTRRFGGWDARIVLHEFDHLEGRLIVDVGSRHEEAAS